MLTCLRGHQARKLAYDCDDSSSMAEPGEGGEARGAAERSRQASDSKRPADHEGYGVGGRKPGRGRGS